MVSENERYLEDENDWDFSQVQVQEPTRRARAVVSVAFGREDFERVTGAAERMGMKTSEFIRRAALDAARGIEAEVFMISGGGQGASLHTTKVDSGYSIGLKQVEMYEVVTA